MIIRKVTRTLPLAALALAAAGAQAGLIVTPTSDAATLVSGLLGANSGITIVQGSQSLLVGGSRQQGTYSGTLEPSGPGAPSFALPDGVVLTTGTADFSTSTNTLSSYSIDSGTGSYAPLVSLALQGGLNTRQFNSNVLSFDFTVDDPTQNAIAAQFLFATEEFPTQFVTDIMGIFVNGVNFAFFPNGDLVSNQTGDPNSFFNLNPVGSGLYPIEWNGMTTLFNMKALINPVGVNTLTIAIADTTDRLYDSAIFFGNMKASTTTGGGIEEPPPDPTPVPEPFSLALLGIGLAGLASGRRRID